MNYLPKFLTFLLSICISLERDVIRQIKRTSTVFLDVVTRSSGELSRPEWKDLDESSGWQRDFNTFRRCAQGEWKAMIQPRPSLTPSHHQHLGYICLDCAAMHILCFMEIILTMHDAFQLNSSLKILLDFFHVNQYRTLLVFSMSTC